MPRKGKDLCAVDGAKYQDSTADFTSTSDAGLNDLEARLQKAAREIAASLSGLEAAQRKELLGGFVSELFFASTEEERLMERRQKQAAGIAAAKARGTRFGRTARALPDNFHEIHQAWRDNKMTLGEAAEACGMPVSTFYDTAIRISGAKKATV